MKNNEKSKKVEFKKNKIKTYKFKNNIYKSIGELEIAKFLTKYNIEFEYEFPISIVESEKTKIWYPDFYLKEYQTVIEYFGMYNHNKAYKNNANFKKQTFQNCGIQFISVYELNKNWETYILKSMKMHQEIKIKKLYKVFDEFNLKQENKFKLIFKRIKFLSYFKKKSKL